MPLPLAPLLAWLAKRIFGEVDAVVAEEVAEKVIEETEDFIAIAQNDPSQPLPYSAVEHQRAQAQAATSHGVQQGPVQPVRPGPPRPKPKGS